MSSSITSIEDLRKLAQKRVPRLFFNHIDTGPHLIGASKVNKIDFDAIKLRQRVGIDWTQHSIRSRMLGEEVSMPVALSPTSFLGMQHVNGEVLCARAAEHFGVPFTLSSLSNCSIEDLAKQVQSPFWFQLYMLKDREFIKNLIGRVRNAGCSALMLTLNARGQEPTYRNPSNGSPIPLKFNLKNYADLLSKPRWWWRMLGTKRGFMGNIVGHVEGVNDPEALAAWLPNQFDSSLNWGTVAWVRKEWDRKLILKGIMDVEDALLAAQSGADAIVVSNYGGSRLDGMPSTIAVLPEIVRAVGDRVEIWLDGGITSGQDVLKALAMGAKGTLVSRAYSYGLGAMGEAGVLKALEILASELDTSMVASGVTDIQQVNSKILWKPSRNN